MLKALRAPRQHNGVTPHPSGRDFGTSWHRVSLGSAVCDPTEFPGLPRLRASNKRQQTKGAGSANQPCSFLQPCARLLGSRKISICIRVPSQPLRGTLAERVPGQGEKDKALPCRGLFWVCWRLNFCAGVILGMRSCAPFVAPVS